MILVKNKIQKLFFLLDRYRISALGICLGLLFFSASMTPSLIPRSALVQGVLGGIVMALGYLLAIIMIGTWRYIQLPNFTNSLRKAISGLLFLVSFSIFLLALFNLRGSQNELRALMTMKPLEANHEVVVVGVVFVSFLTLFLLGRFIATITIFLRNRIHGRVQPRLSLVISLLLVTTISWNLGNGVIARTILNTADDAFREVDSRIDIELPVPSDNLRSGSTSSLIPWETLGAQGRKFIAGGRSIEEISEFNGSKPAKKPIRVYAGLNSGKNIKERANLVLEEMKRVGVFDRSFIVIVTPTGTGWIDPAAVDPFEIMHLGDTAIVGMQYSYLMSPLALLVEPDLVPESAKILFDTIYKYWRQLPDNSRSRLYLYGLSLGSYGSEKALSPLKMVDNPISGILWSGPTFMNPIWNNLTKNRNPGSSAWLPQIDDGRLARFTNQQNTLDKAVSACSRMRLVYLQYASDPITFFEVASAFRPPEWMADDRAPDVFVKLRWYPLITMLQQAVDMLIATEVPKGFGHVFSAEHYINAWFALTDPKDWQVEDTERLKNSFR
ncbi:MAG: alpha/beta-hydrolase family protein [gamma proteobacterium symbiont of Taylorina sp.]|nr:alpha/beta-hydrolase family protein [gamma proteobacterium symbiont of Taylorina sp.]